MFRAQTGSKLFLYYSQHTAIKFFSISLFLEEIKPTMKKSERELLTFKKRINSKIVSFTKLT